MLSSVYDSESDLNLGPIGPVTGMSGTSKLSQPGLAHCATLTQWTTYWHFVVSAVQLPEAQWGSINSPINLIPDKDRLNAHT